MVKCSYQARPIMRPQLWIDRRRVANSSLLVTTMPPSPLQRFLLDWKENMPMSPMAPTRRPLYSAPWAWAASSISVSL